MEELFRVFCPLSVCITRWELTHRRILSLYQRLIWREARLDKYPIALSACDELFVEYRVVLLNIMDEFSRGACANIGAGDSPQIQGLM